MRTDVLILGGGLAGLAAARRLGELGAAGRLVVEAKERPGGLAGSQTHGGFIFDYTGHLLHLHDPAGTALVLGLLGGNLALHERRAWIRLRGIDIPYPFQANTRGLPRKMLLDCVAGALELAHRPRRLSANPDFLSWSKAAFGEGVTRHFMEPYNRKLWNRDLRRLTADWQGRFVPRPSPAQVLEGALGTGGARHGYNAAFRYPRRGGIQALPDALAAGLPPGVLRLGARAAEVDLREKVARVEGLGEVRYERLINTLPLPDFLRLARPLPRDVREAAARLRWNSVWNLNLGVARPGVSDKHWVYFPERRYPFYRVGFASNFSPAMAPAGHSSLYVEVSRPGGARVERAMLEAAILRGLREAGLLRAGDEISAKAWMPIPVGYVVYDFARAPALAAIFRHLAGAGVESIGRYGAWKYSFMEETLLDGLACAERVAAGRRPPSAPWRERAREPLK